MTGLVTGYVERISSMSFLRHGEIFRSDELVGEPQTGCRSPLIVSMSFRLAIPGGLLSSRARFRFFCHDHSGTNGFRCQPKSSEQPCVPFARVSKLDTIHLTVPFGVRPLRRLD